MRRMVSLISLFFLPVTAWGACDGTDLIAALAPERQQALSTRADAQPYPKGLLWRAMRDDTTITLFGTYHFPHERTEAHLQVLEPLIDAADDVYLEISNADHARMEDEVSRDPSIMFITEGATLPDLLGEQDWQSYAAAMKQRGIPGFMAAKFKPLWAAMMLGLGPCEARKGAMQAKGIDMRIGEHAADIGTPGKSLEDYRTLLTMLDSFPQDDQLDMIRLFLAWPLDADDMAYTLRQRYLAQDVALIWEYSRLLSLTHGGESAAEDFALFEKILLVDRNRAWVDLLLDKARGRTVFAAVGAAHLPGRHGVLTLLAEAGFRITRLPFDP